MTRIAVVSDVHGNLPALHAVAEDIARRGIEVVVNLGDHASGPLWPQETVAFLMRQPWVQIAGNCDRQLVRAAPTDHGASERFAFERLAPAQILWLASLPATATALGGISLFHGTPSDDATYLLEVVQDGLIRLARPSELAIRLSGVATEVVLCGHSHIPRIVRHRAMLIVNPGSVGLPAYEHCDPDPHVMETGSPDARYALLEQSSEGWRAELIAIPYDHIAAAEQARRQMRPDWALSLRTGYVTS